MQYQVRYYTRSGNTEKLAKAIAESIGCTAAKVDTPLAEKTDILFLGCSYYAFDMDPSVKAFLAENKDKIGKIVCFGTSAMMKSMKKPMKKAVQEYGIPVAEEEFHCRGEFWKAHPGRPDAEDLQKAAAFAKSVAE
ncbi:MAG: flavodoxin [Ruminococcaceae bacterium]|nr:flavodoxin [Oscillospiraceae bacterium]